MKKILSVSQIRELDAWTINHEPIAGIDLMERACKAFVSWFTPSFHTSSRIAVICGTGNNGGDGAGIARLLEAWGYTPHVYIARGRKESPDFKINLGRLPSSLPVSEITGTEGIEFDQFDVIIDALFGSGLTRPAEGVEEAIIGAINRSEALVIAVDIPSGLMADTPSSGPVVQADHTVSFQLPKLSFMLPSSGPFVGEWHIVDIGLDKQFIRDAPCSHFYITRSFVASRIRPRQKFAHKGSFGHALIVAGSYGKMGAAVLCARAALRTGAGLLSVYGPSSGNIILQTSVPEAMFLADAGDQHLTTGLNDDLSRYSVIAAGPGLGTQTATIQVFKELLKSSDKPMVVDADALNMLALNPDLLELLPKRSILTPHPKEFERLAGSWQHDFERLEKQRKIAKDTGCVWVVKGAHTSIADPDGNIYFNATGNPGMATGGSGDVLTGITAALLSQGYTSLDAAIVGVYVHGLAGDLAYYERGSHALIASDIVEFIPAAFRKLYRSGKKD